jgi:hypothetical protein
MLLLSGSQFNIKIAMPDNVGICPNIRVLIPNGGISPGLYKRRFGLADPCFR